jgi:hypothetical protein|tara:strand:- start:131 stop:433 length:303 start_codon:yes stop_codon:yes gene_type:complete
MATTTWTLKNVDYDVSDGFCHTAHWTITRIDGDYTSSRYGAVTLNRPSSLTARTDLKSADIIADVKAVLGTDQVTAIETSLESDITEQKTPTQGSFVPAS